MRLAVTGHRPDKLGGYGEGIRKKLTQLALGELARLGPGYVLSGMAQGWDQAVVEACVELGIPFQACIPFYGQESVWPAEAQERYLRLLGAAEDVVIVSPGGYSPQKMLARNRYLVDHCDHLLALWNGSKGGTGHCLHYASERRVLITNCWPRFSAVRPKAKKGHPSVEKTGPLYVPSQDQSCPFVV